MVYSKVFTDFLELKKSIMSSDLDFVRKMKKIGYHKKEWDKLLKEYGE